MWKTGSKTKIEYEGVLSFLELASAYEHQIYVGTDSQPFFSGTFLVTAIVVLSSEPEYHSRYFYLEHENRPRHHSLYERVFQETILSLQVAEEIRQRCPSARVEVHLDVSPEDSRGGTSRYSRGLVSMVRGYGYPVEVKPNSWCASKVADHHTKRLPARFRT